MSATYDGLQYGLLEGDQATFYASREDAIAEQRRRWRAWNESGEVGPEPVFTVRLIAVRFTS